jgi:hypothetical protein
MTGMYAKQDVFIQSIIEYLIMHSIYWLYWKNKSFFINEYFLLDMQFIMINDVFQHVRFFKKKHSLFFIFSVKMTVVFEIT